jgi:hypothetical protein
VEGRSDVRVGVKNAKAVLHENHHDATGAVSVYARRLLS